MGCDAWLVTAEILDEYKEVARRLKVRPSVAGYLINLLSEEAEEVAVESVFEISPDPGDNAFCACAQEGRADFLVPLIQRTFRKGNYRQEWFLHLTFGRYSGLGRGGANYNAPQIWPRGIWMQVQDRCNLSVLSLIFSDLRCQPCRTINDLTVLP